MSQSDIEPVGAIFIFEGRDLVVQADRSAAERFVEPYDIESGDIFDELGRPLQAVAIGDMWPKRVQLSVRDPEPQTPLLVKRVREYLQAIGHSVPTHPEDHAWLHEAARTLLRRQRSSTPWGRIRTRLWGHR